MKINIVLHYWAGLHRHAPAADARVGLRSLPIVMFLATMFTASGAPAIHFLVGHSVFLPAFYLPFLLYCYFTAIESGAMRGALIGGGAHRADGLQRRHAHPADGLCRHRRAVGRVRRPCAVNGGRSSIGLVCCVAGLAYSAPKLLPVVSFVDSEQFWDTRPVIEHPDRTTLEMAGRIYLDPYQMSRREVSRATARLARVRQLHRRVCRPADRGQPVLDRWPRVARRTTGSALSLAVATIGFFLLSLGEFSQLRAGLHRHPPAAVLELPHSQPLQHPVRALRGDQHRLVRLARWGWTR